jgi:hypothetical protein
MRLRQAMLTYIFVGCWRGSVPAPAPQEEAPIEPSKPSSNATVRWCQTDDGKLAVLLEVRDLFSVVLDLAELQRELPRVVGEGDGARISTCGHGCTPGHIDVDVFQPHRRIRGGYFVVAKSIPLRKGKFDAPWIGDTSNLEPCWRP